MSRLTLAQRGARVTTTLVVSRPRLWRLLRRPFRRYFELLAPRWDGIVEAGRLEAMVVALADVSPPRRALDVGTGTGSAAFLVAERFPGAKVTGVDLAPGMVAAARAKTPPRLARRVRFVEADAAELPVATGSCDLITLANTVPFFDELVRVLAPEGTLIVCFAEGPDTPIWVPPERLRAELARRGLVHFAELAVGTATCLLATRRRPDAYDTHAGGYTARIDPTLAGAVERVVELAGARPGIRLLDLATGTGTIARAGAERGACVVGVDVSSGMLEVARTLSPGLDLRLAGACALPFTDGAFEVATCGLALSHFADREKALGEVLRVLRPGGKFIASAWGEGSSIPTRRLAEILDRYAGPAIEVDEASWSSAQRGTDILRAAGFTEVSVRSDVFRGEFADVEEALAWFAAWPLAAARIAALDPGGRERFFADARRALAATDLSWRFAFNFYVAMACSASLRRLT